MKLVKPQGGRHIDMVKALTYIPRLLAQPKPVQQYALSHPISFMG
jgi:hypothetical protein